MTGRVRVLGVLLLGGLVAVAGGCGEALEPRACELVIAGLEPGAPVPASGDVLVNVALVVAGPSDIDWAASTVGQDQLGQPQVTLQLHPEATQRMADFTRTHVGESMPLALNGQVLAAPVVMAPIPNGSVAISGMRDDRQVAQLAACVDR